ncbi:hypothetical protein [Sphingobium sp. WCS2017Hpa-17]|uniref:hypothetical protein n=1 Tax=Sphingobium sp. WCS2017Hpa-17 TaxID=3073638 RepID=UPI0028892873|nr:hypothetical protein [Sphingobium sp. WCS2017Hpa-17]
MDTPTVPLTAARNLDLREEYGLLGEDDGPLNLTGCTLKMEVRLYGAQPGAALISLPQVTTDILGIRVTDAVNGKIRMIIPKANLAALPGGPVNGSEPNQPDVFVYDLLIDRPSPLEPLAMAGTFTVSPGVTVL